MRLQNAASATWAPYAMLRTPIEEHHAHSQALNESPGPSPAKMTSNAIPKASAAGGVGEGSGGGEGARGGGGPKEIQVSTANIPGTAGGGGGGGERGGGGRIESPGSSPEKPKKSRGKHNQMTDWRMNPMESRDGKADLLLDDPRLVPVCV
jgi:hypothetical protein